ncbi:MAG TPA: SDR family oxidoreductase [Novimethylophilus sp.]|jgi:NAD(P)-dependent dehydrogenase (short-subunit alcohol dehydrogenase family)|uniref:SDR family oxidoreductase n=1 Tax=Novimethylophilus sp. TaxID=2137426 RepID=UPI002F42EBFF
MDTLLITGANRGLGLEFVKQYAAAGWRVLACCRDPGQARALGKIAADSQGRVMSHALDMADFHAIDTLAEELRDIPIDLIINNAGIYPDRNSGFGRTDYDVWASAFRVNAMAPLKMAEAFIGHLERAKGKSIATVGSKMGSVADNTSGGCYLYRSSKAAVNIVVKSLAIDLAGRGIKAVVLHPGWVQTDMGGPNALITAEQSVAGMCNVLTRLTVADSGRFIAYDGKDVPW